MQTADKLIRKQYLISPLQIKKLEQLAKKNKKSAGEMVRSAIDAYNPDIPMDMKESELIELVSIKVKDAIADTQETRKRLHATLQKLTVRGE